LPSKRFVALLSWPRTTDLNVTPLLTSALSAIKSELTHLETVDRNLFVISPEDVHLDVAYVKHLKEVSDPLGANLVLAASGMPSAGQFQLNLRLLDPASGQALREKRIACPIAEITTLPAKAVRAAAALLNLAQHLDRQGAQEPETQSPEAFIALQTAESLLKQGSANLTAAIEKYKQAIELDSRYALAYAKLAQAYARYYYLHRSAAALELARGNSQAALDLAPNLVDGHLARAAIFEWTGNEEEALRTIALVLSLDPSNARALIWQAQIYGRLNRWEEADQAFRRILKQYPNNWLAYNEYGYSLELQGKYRESVEVFRTASLAAPGNSLTLSNFGGELLQVGQYSEGIDALKKSLMMDPDSDQSAAYISIGLRYLGKNIEALPFARKAVEINPDLDLNWLSLGDCYWSLRNRQSDAREAYLKAAKLADLHLAMDPSDGPAWLLLALYRVKSNTSQDPSMLIEKAESFGAQDVNSQLYKVRILELLGKREAALQTLAACFDRGAGDIQVATFPDMHLLRTDPRYRKLVSTQSSSSKATGL
jgi:eukaryotic-like serine/threonine-protein kinase